MKIRIKKSYLKTFLTLLIIIGIGLGIFIFKNNAAYKKSIVEASEKIQISPNYYEYSDASFEMSKSRGETLLFFAATTWCNTCSALDEEIQKESLNLPTDLTILKINYDNDKNTNKKYFVTMQHTLVLIDSDGNEKTRWVGGDFENLINNLKN